MIDAIERFPTPTNVTELQQFLGTINYVDKFIPNKSMTLEPLNSLLKDNVAFVWGESQQKAFRKIIECIKKAPILAHYDFTKKIIIQADALSYGLKAALLQEKEGENREAVAYASRTLNKCEKRYSQIEKEALALVFATERFKEYVLGIDVTIETDHKPLLQLLQTKHFDELTPRLQGMRLKLMRYNYKLVHIPGKQLVLADSLSRNPIEFDDGIDDNINKDMEAYINYVIGSLPATKSTLEKIRIEQENDPVCIKIKEYCLTKWPSKDKIDNTLKPYIQHKNEISYCERFCSIIRG